MKDAALKALADADAGAKLPPKTLGMLADEFHEARIARLAADKVAAALKTEESRLEATLIDQMIKQESTACGGKKLKVSIPAEPDYKPTVKDWDKVYEYILKTKDFSLLHKRIGEGAVAERWEAGENVPGVEKFPVYKLSRSEIK